MSSSGCAVAGAVVVALTGSLASPVRASDSRCSSPECEPRRPSPAARTSTATPSSPRARSDSRSRSNSPSSAFASFAWRVTSSIETFPFDSTARTSTPVCRPSAMRACTRTPSRPVPTFTSVIAISPRTGERAGCGRSVREVVAGRGCGGAKPGGGRSMGAVITNVPSGPAASPACLAGCFSRFPSPLRSVSRNDVDRFGSSSAPRPWCSERWMPLEPFDCGVLMRMASVLSPPSDRGCPSGSGFGILPRCDRRTRTREKKSSRASFVFWNASDRAGWGLSTRPSSRRWTASSR